VDGVNKSIADFELKAVIGRGNFGKVFLAQHKENGNVYAVKQFRKDVLLKDNLVEPTIREKEILFKVKHPFLVGMSYVF